MGGLFHTLGLGSESLYANRQGVDTASHNIANAQTEGYSRQRLMLETREATWQRGNLIGNGVFVRDVERSHNKYIEAQLNRAKSQFGASEERNSMLKNVESVFSPELNASVSDELTAFFGAVQVLTTYPDDLNTRTQLQELAQNVTSSFRRVNSELVGLQKNIDDKVMHMTTEMTQLTKQIASYNIQIKQLEVGEATQANDLRDQRDMAIRLLSEKVDIHYYEDQNGMVTIRGPKEITIVDRGHASKFSVTKSEKHHPWADVVIIPPEGTRSQAVGDAIEGGKLSGLMEVRDQVLEKLVEQNDKLAYTFSNKFNEIHRQGFGVGDYRETQGRDFFEGVGDVKGAAREIRLSDIVQTSTDAISIASTSASSGDNVVGNMLLRLKDSAVLEGDATFQSYYANMIGTLGIQAARAEHMLEADKVLQGDLQSRREAVSGVSLDEEAANMIRWQTSFTASSKVITTVDEMLETVLRLKR
ncbi:MAG: flagellar hook-associated protein FlgK [Oligoflexales bacterium]